MSDTAFTLPDGPVPFAFCPAYDFDDTPQQIRIVIRNMPGFIPTAMVPPMRSTSAAGLISASATTAKPGPPLPHRPCATAVIRIRACTDVLTVKATPVAVHCLRARKPQTIQTGRLITPA